MFTRDKHTKNKIMIATVFLILVAITCVSMKKINSKADGVSQKQVFSDDTVVTEDNILDILDSLRVKHGELEKADGNLVMRDYTVKDLKKALQKVELGNSEKENTLNNYVDIGGPEDLQDIQMRKDSIINKKLSQNEAHDGYELEYSVNVKYNKTKKQYVETTGQDVGIDSDLFPIVYKIGKKSLSSSCTSSKVTLNANVTVKAYVGAGDIGLVEVASQKIKSKVYWHAK